MEPIGCALEPSLQSLHLPFELFLVSEAAGVHLLHLKLRPLEVALELLGVRYLGAELFDFAVFGCQKQVHLLRVSLFDVAEFQKQSLPLILQFLQISGLLEVLLPQL